MTDKKNLLKVAKREKTFSTLAKKEAEGSEERMKKEHGAAKIDSEWEHKVDEAFAKARAKIATAAKKKAMAMKK